MAAHCIFTKDTGVRDSGFSAGESAAKGGGSSTVAEAVAVGRQSDKAALIMHGHHDEPVLGERDQLLPERRRQVSRVSSPWPSPKGIATD